MRAIINLSIAMVLVALGVVSCGGGSGAVIVGPGNPGGGGGGDGGSGGSSSSASCVAAGAAEASTVANVATITVDGGPACAQSMGPQVNVLYATITICAPGSTTNCQTIDHVQVDTGSYGLRVLSEVLQPQLAQALTPVTETQSGQALAECVQFADGYSWGPVVSADVQISGEKAQGIGVQVIGQPDYMGAYDDQSQTYANVPTSCTDRGSVSENTVADFGANGILGVGPFVTDCGASCASQAQSGYYYTCSAPSSCVDSAVSEAQQMSNPVAFFAQDNNGVIIQLPSIPHEGQPTVSGSLVFGIGTQSNNTMTAQAVLTGDANDGRIATIYPAGSNSTFTDGYIDSGSNAYFFQDSSIPQCSRNQGFYCPNTTGTQAFTATNVGTNGAQSNVTFNLANADNLNGANTAFDDIGGSPVTQSSQQSQPPSDIFDWGLPFFFGRSVYTAIDGRTAGPAPGPYFAY